MKEQTPFLQRAGDAVHIIRTITSCSDCRFWDTTDTYQEGFGKCALTQSENGSASNKVSRAYAVDREGLEAWLYTRHDFSCIQFAPRNEAGGE